MLALAGLLPGCGGPAAPSSASSSATITAAVETYHALDDDTAEPERATSRQITFRVRPHCDDRSLALDCEGFYESRIHYRYRAGKPDSIRCDMDRPGKLGGTQFNKAGNLPVLPAWPPTLPREASCFADASGLLTTEASIPMADASKFGDDPTDRPSPDFTVVTRMTVDRSGALHYEWTSRDGARCTGQLAVTKGHQQYECHWHSKRA
jgi:hypothetical protein